MHVIKVGKHYINLDNVDLITEGSGYRPSDTKYEHYDPCLYLYNPGSEDSFLKLFDEDMIALQAWLDRVSFDLMLKADEAASVPTE